MKERLTRKNPVNGGSGATYRLPFSLLEQDIHFKTQGGYTFAYGSLIDRLGELEDLYFGDKKRSDS